MRVRSDFAIEFVCFLHQCLQLFKTVLGRTDSVAFREHATSSAGLDYVRAIFDLVAHRRTNLLNTISYAVFNSALHQSGPKSVGVAMSATNAECVSGCF